MSTKLKVRLISPWSTDVETPEAIFSVKIASEEADALLCEWAPNLELLSFPRRKAWYCCEPQSAFRQLGGGEWSGIRQRLAASEFLCHNHEDPRYRMPHVTHYQRLDVNLRGEREIRAIAVVSNHGGRPWRRHRDVSYRNRFITNSRVDLFGRASWRDYQASWLSRPAVPHNYRGELPCHSHDTQKRDIMSRYYACICLKSMIEPYYFTEKFVEAVRAGCIPVYRAHPTIATTVLRGARWIDPQLYNNDPAATIDAALSMANPNSIQSVNREWLSGSVLAETHAHAVFSRIGKILAQKA